MRGSATGPGAGTFQTPEPFWMQQEGLPEWAAAKKGRWEERAKPVREEMIKALSPSSATKAPVAPAAKPEAAAAKPVEAETA